MDDGLSNMSLYLLTDELMFLAAGCDKRDKRHALNKIYCLNTSDSSGKFAR